MLALVAIALSPSLPYQTQGIGGSCIEENNAPPLVITLDVAVPGGNNLASSEWPRLCEEASRADSTFYPYFQFELTSPENQLVNPVCTLFQTCASRGDETNFHVYTLTMPPPPSPPIPPPSVPPSPLRNPPRR